MCTRGLRAANVPRILSNNATHLNIRFTCKCKVHALIYQYCTKQWKKNTIHVIGDTNLIVRISSRPLESYVYYVIIASILIKRAYNLSDIQSYCSKLFIASFSFDWDQLSWAPIISLKLIDFHLKFSAIPLLSLICLKIVHWLISIGNWEKKYADRSLFRSKLIQPAEIFRHGMEVWAEKSTSPRRGRGRPEGGVKNISVFILNNFDLGVSFN